MNKLLIVQHSWNNCYATQLTMTEVYRPGMRVKSKYEMHRDMQCVEWPGGGE
jgi:hypothetical protein